MTRTGAESPPASMPSAPSSDPRLPKLADLPAFRALMASGWGEPDRTPRVEPGAAQAAASHRDRLSEAMQGWYLSIVGGGHHAAVLHWTRADGPIEPGEVVLLDMGVEGRSYYTADVTRTVPASGRFSPAQREVHDLVEAAHRAGIAAAQPGRPYTDFHHAAMEVLAQGLHDWGMLPVSIDEALSEQGQQHRRYIVSGVGHHLGLDVHDCARSSHEAYQGATLAAGMVFTVEPGLYFQAFDRTVPPELRGLGVRIEDDVMVTPAGSVVLSDALPIDASGIERWVAAEQAVEGEK